MNKNLIRSTIDNRILVKPFMLCILFVFFHFLLPAQIFPAKNYPKDYFAYPVGAVVALSANYGELRPNHYHMGLDCKTGQKQNMPVLAAADGYIAKVKIEPYGFGRAIYINHPNGLTTLYAHLNDFFPELELYVKQQQYRLEKWEVFLDIPQHLFPVTRNRFIAYSGNTGGSQGPHLHFEIRDTKTDKVLNPLLFGFNIPDNVPPVVTRLAMYDRNISTYEQTPKFFPLVKKNGSYTTPVVVSTNSNLVSFAISATDRYSGSSNPNGIYEASLFVDEVAIAGFQLDNISYDETRYLNAHIDYKLKLNGGPYVQHLSRLPGYPAGVYHDIKSDGTIPVYDDSLHQVKIIVKDTYGNTSVVQFSLKKAAPSNTTSVNNSLYQQQVFHPGYINIFERDNIQVILGEKDLYDSIRFTYATKAASPAEKYSGQFHLVHNGAVPVHGYFTIKIKPDFIIPPEAQNCMVIKQQWGSRTDIFKAKYEGGWYSSRFRSFGSFQLMADIQPPTITPIGIKENANLGRSVSFSFVVRDNSDEFKNFRAELDGKWLRFSNDKGRTFTYKFDENCPPGPHELKVSVEDEANNVTTKRFNFTR